MSGASAEVTKAIDSAFETLAYRLDEIAAATGMKSDEMMHAVNSSGSFAGYYGDWIRESWDGWEPIEIPEAES